MAAHFLVKFLNATANVIALFIILSMRMIISNVCAKKFLKLAAKFQISIRKKLHAEIFNKEISSGEILTLTFDTIQALNEFFIKILPNVTSTIILLPIFLFAALIMDWLTALILLVTLPIAPLLLWLIGKATAERNAQVWAELQKLNGDFKEILSAVVALKMFGRIAAAASKLKLTSEKSSAATLEVLKLAFVSSFALELITTLSIALVAVTLGLRLIAGAVEFEVALFLLLIAPEIFAPIRKLGVMFHVAIAAKLAVERLEKFLLSEPVKVSGTEKLKLPPEISLLSVSYTYPLKKVPVLREMNLKISAGKITAITGESGCGKSTLIKLLAGLILPTSGEIFFNELPSSKMQRASLFSKIAYMPQKPHLFNATLADNFSMFNRLGGAELPKLLAELDLNLDLSSMQKVSCGQLQRVGLVRSLLKNSSLILLDEPTANLDEESELKILNVLKEYSLRRTVVIATHRRAVIEIADTVIKL